MDECADDLMSSGVPKSKKKAKEAKSANARLEEMLGFKRFQVSKNIKDDTKKFAHTFDENL